MKRCPICGESKPFSDFPRDRARKDGRYSYCLLCHNARHRRYSEAMRATPEGRLKHRRQGWLAVLRTYGVSEDQYLTLFEAQGGVCAICGKPETFRNTDGVRPLCVDHDHVTGKVRGLLCHSCNVAIGHFRDDPATLHAAIRYLLGDLTAAA